MVFRTGVRHKQSRQGGIHVQYRGLVILGIEPFTSIVLRQPDVVVWKHKVLRWPSDFLAFLEAFLLLTAACDFVLRLSALDVSWTTASVEDKAVSVQRLEPGSEMHLPPEAFADLSRR